MTDQDQGSSGAILIGGLLLLGLIILLPLGALAVALVVAAYFVGQGPLRDWPSWLRPALGVAALLAVIGQVLVGPTSTSQNDDSDDRAPSVTLSSDSGDTESEILPCPSYLEALAERNGGGFVRGVDAEYDPRMDWDGDGVSCE